MNARSIIHLHHFVNGDRGRAAQGVPLLAQLSAPAATAPQARHACVIMMGRSMG
jgi:hypothetical protein